LQPLSDGRKPSLARLSEPVTSYLLP
jgi:hypothetical protein